ncbi:hypothetical protein JTB14_021204 [Gonioctena quinquepunctata]|nr:hypothetical protein JTB14_021204 [Gonioctena quinquepunctata]
MSVSEICTQSISKKCPGLQCKGFCSAFYHANSVCSDVSKNQLAAISSLPGGMWACPECRRPTGTRTRSHSALDQGMIMVQADGTADDDASGVAGNGATPTKISSNEFLKSLKSEIQMLRESVDFCSNKVTNFDEKLLKMNEYFKITGKLKKENASMRNDVLELKKQIDNLEYSTRSNNIEIHEVPEKNYENLVDVVTKIGRFLNMSLDPDSIDTAFRVPSRAENKPKNIVVKFKFERSRDYFSTAAKVARKDPNNQRGFNLDLSPIDSS